jgi:hypothetical protein
VEIALEAVVLIDPGHQSAYRKFGKRAIYRWADLIAWAEANTAPLRHSTSELTAISAEEPAR